MPRVEERRPDVDPADLTIGHHYRLRIVTELGAGAKVLTAGIFDYDNVLLRATRAASGCTVKAKIRVLPVG